MLAEQILQALNALRINTKDVLTQEEVAIYTGFTMSHIYTLISRRIIPHYKRGGKTYFKREEIEQWMTTYKRYTHEENEARAEEYDRLKQEKKKSTKQ